MIALNWAAARGIDLWAKIASVDLLTTFEIENLRTALRVNYQKEVSAKTQKSPRKRRKPTTVGHSTYYNRCHMVRDFLAWHVRNVVQRIKTSDPKLPEARHRLDMFERQMVENLAKPHPREREGIDEPTQELFLEAIRPGSPLNPFQKKHQPRNYALLLLYYVTSIRRAEGMKIKGEHLIGLGSDKPSLVIVRDPDDPADPRGVEPRIKTLPREVPLSRELATALLEWVVRHRTDPNRYPGAKRTPYVFVSRTGKPIGARTINDMFELLRKRVPGLPDDFTTHLLRHTGNDRFSAAADAQGLKEAEEKQARNYIMGWTKNSNQGDRYTRRHTRRRAQALMTRMQQKSTEGHNR
ncbi:tyrosine-type recombinase/integrase [Microvirga tunisiensis]|uniref:tyrosine-type recombinase/integrase n=1 Tax=Microvirga tunisiensis TaxID=2108360 RepID=UPI001386E845